MATNSSFFGGGGLKKENFVEWKLRSMKNQTGRIGGAGKEERRQDCEMKIEIQIYIFSQGSWREINEIITST